MQENMPNKEILLQQLQLEWQDHIQTRIQTWKTLEIEAALVLGLIGIDWKFNNLGVVILCSIVLVMSCIAGIGITIHHRKGQIRKFTHIDRLEEALGLHCPKLLDNVHPPKDFKWSDVVNPKKNYTPIFILRMHIAILCFTIIYFGARVIL